MMTILAVDRFNVAPCVLAVTLFVFHRKQRMRLLRQPLSVLWIRSHALLRRCNRSRARGASYFAGYPSRFLSSTPLLSSSSSASSASLPAISTRAVLGILVALVMRGV